MGYLYLIAHASTIMCQINQVRIFLNGRFAGRPPLRFASISRCGKGSRFDKNHSDTNSHGICTRVHDVMKAHVDVLEYA